MEEPRSATLLRVFIGESDRAAGRPLYRAILDAAFKAKLAGATAFSGPLSYGHRNRINDEFNVDAPGNLPIIVEIIDAEDKIEAFLPKLDGMLGQAGTGLATLEVVEMMRVGWRTKLPPGKAQYTKGDGSHGCPA